MNRAEYLRYKNKMKRLVSDYIKQGKTWQELMEDNFELGINSPAIKLASNIPANVLELQPGAFELKRIGFDIAFDPNTVLAVVYRIEYLRQKAVRDAKARKRPWEKWMVIDIGDDFT